MVAISIRHSRRKKRAISSVPVLAGLRGGGRRRAFVRRHNFLLPRASIYIHMLPGLTIPCYREGECVPQLLDALIAEWEINGRPDMRVLVVDDGTPEPESRVMLDAVRAREGRLPGLEWLRMPDNLGKGATVRTGWNHHLAAGCGHLAFIDADGAVSAPEFFRLLGEARKQPDTAIFASRVKMRGRVIHRTARRHFSGRVFATLVGLLIDPGIYDSQCGCKILPAEAFRSFADDLREDGFAFDVELLAALNRDRRPVVEIPVDWTDQPGSKVRMLRDSIRMTAALLRIRRRFPPID